jgi:hypothetical protein
MASTSSNSLEVVINRVHARQHHGK